MIEQLYLDLDLRPDLEIIANLVKPGERVLDLGCGDGSFLKMLKEKHEADVLGLELSQEAIIKCIANGVPVVQSNLENELDFAGDGDFDWVIVSQTLQEMRRPDVILQRIVRVGKRAAVSFINFGHIACRLQLLATGRMPRNKHMPYEWFDTPNIHFGTLRDFRCLCQDLGISIVQATPVGHHFPLLTNLLPNLFAVGEVFVIEKKSGSN